MEFVSKGIIGDRCRVDLVCDGIAAAADVLDDAVAPSCDLVPWLQDADLRRQPCAIRSRWLLLLHAGRDLCLCRWEGGLAELQLLRDRGILQTAQDIMKGDFIAASLVAQLAGLMLVVSPVTDGCRCPGRQCLL